MEDEDIIKIVLRKDRATKVSKIAMILIMFIGVLLVKIIPDSQYRDLIIFLFIYLGIILINFIVYLYSRFVSFKYIIANYFEIMPYLLMFLIMMEIMIRRDVLTNEGVWIYLCVEIATTAIAIMIFLSKFFEVRNVLVKIEKTEGEKYRELKQICNRYIIKTILMLLNITFFVAVVVDFYLSKS